MFSGIQFRIYSIVSRPWL